MRRGLTRYFVKWQIVKVTTADVIKAVANPRRLDIMNWLKDPRRHFPRQVDGDLVKDGVCAALIADKLGVSQPALSEHMKILVNAGLVRGKRIKQWTFYKRDEAEIRQVKQTILKMV
jgi:DNA-binding transcriptional ArsR family regulator